MEGSMARIAIAFVLGLALALAACGGRDEAQKAAREAREATEVTVESAGAPTGEAAREATQVTVESAKGDEEAED
jgi:ABC-type glycerol-3-phosphate transport system substrate-binding protein